MTRDLPIRTSSVKPGRRRGQSMVELAVMLPLITLILVGTVDLARVFFYYTRLTNAVKEGALVGASTPQLTERIRQRAYDEADGRLGTTGPGADFEVTPTCVSSCAAGNAVEVVGTYKFRPLTTYVVGFWGNTFTIRKTVRIGIVTG